jgi:hypothetical protein
MIIATASQTHITYIKSTHKWAYCDVMFFLMDEVKDDRKIVLQSR